MPFNEKGEIIRPKNREKNRSDIQRSTPSNDGDASVSENFYLPGWLFSFVFFVLLVVYLKLDHALLIGSWIASFFWPISVFLVFVMCAESFDLFNSVFYWSGYFLTIVLGMWTICSVECWGSDYKSKLLLNVIFIFCSLIGWPSLLLLWVISLLDHYFRSFMEKVSVLAVLVMFVSVIAYIMAVIDHLI